MKISSLLTVGGVTGRADTYVHQVIGDGFPDIDKASAPATCRGVTNCTATTTPLNGATDREGEGGASAVGSCRWNGGGLATFASLTCTLTQTSLA